MNPYLLRLILPALAAPLLAAVAAAADPTYANYVRQTQMPAGVTWDASDAVAAAGTRESALEINPGGARFDLWTYKSEGVLPIVEYLLDSSYVGTYVPIAQMVMDTEDPYGKDLTAPGPLPVNSPAKIRRTRADRPFTVYVTLSGLLNGASDPVATKSVKYLRHVQSYGTGVGIGLDRTQATLRTSSFIATNGLLTQTFALTSIPGANLNKLRGEERFSVFSIADYQAPESQLASQFIQIWPVADGAISGIAPNQLIQNAMPALTLTYNDLYPNSRTYVQAYKGEQVLGATGVVLPGSTRIVDGSAPETHVLTPTNSESIFTSDGRWTIEIVTVTPFDTTRLHWISFSVDRTIEVNGTTVTTIE